MKPEVLTALRGSIKGKWEPIVAGTGVDRGCQNCLLCQLFTPIGGRYPDCEPCPVMDVSGKIMCSNTPYDNWRDHHEVEHYNETGPDRVRCPECLVTMAAVEDVHAMPKQGVSSTFKFGRNFGTWLGILSAHGIPFELVAPRTWQKQFFKKADGKLSAVNTAQRLFPGAPLTGLRGAPKDGRADALLIAYWLYLRHHGNAK